MKINEKNKNIILGIFVLGLVISSLSVFGATTSSSGRTQQYFHDISITMVNHEPDPAEAGRYVTVRFKVENTGAETAEDITLELLPKYPFSLEPGESALKYIGSVRSRQSGDTGVITDYRLRVDEDALEGDNEIELRYKVNKNAWIKLDPFDINIEPHDIILNIESVDAPKMIQPGETAQVDINLENLALSFIKEVRVRLNLDGVPLATSGSTNRKIIKEMEAGSKASASFDVIAEPDAESNLYKVPIELEFFDRLGNNYKKNETVGLIIGAVPDLSINIDSSQVYSSGGSGEVVIKFVNKGVTDIKFLNTVLEESDDFSILSQKEVYIGNIDSDDYETADFKIILGKVKDEEVLLPLSVEYKDANNNEYSEDVNLPLKLYSASEAKSMGLSNGNGKVGIIIVLIIVIGGFFVYRRWKRKRRHEKAGEGFKLKVPFLEKK